MTANGYKLSLQDGTNIQQLDYGGVTQLGKYTKYHWIVYFNLVNCQQNC